MGIPAENQRTKRNAPPLLRTAKERARQVEKIIANSSGAERNFVEQVVAKAFAIPLERWVYNEPDPRFPPIHPNHSFNVNGTNRYSVRADGGGVITVNRNDGFMLWVDGNQIMSVYMEIVRIGCINSQLQVDSRDSTYRKYGYTGIVYLYKHINDYQYEKQKPFLVAKKEEYNLKREKEEEAQERQNQDILRRL